MGRYPWLLRMCHIGWHLWLEKDANASWRWAVGKGVQIRKRSIAKVAVLLSGGIDSTACVAFYLEQGCAVHALFIDYGQVSATRELRASRAIAEHYGVPYTKLKLSGAHKKAEGLIVGRNAFLLLSALMEIPDRTAIVAIGVHGGTAYSDRSPLFVRKIQSLFDIYTQGVVRIGAPFLRWSKAKIWRFCMTRDLPMELTYSCECGTKQPCGRCQSCRDLEVLFATN